MARRFSFLLPLAGAVVLQVLPGCSGDQNSSPRSAPARTHEQSADDLREAERNQPPHVGMTTEQVIRRYGPPRSVVPTERGERWTYILNEGEVAAKSLIPFYTPGVRLGFLNFGEDGRVKYFRWDNPEDR